MIISKNQAFCLGIFEASAFDGEVFEMGISQVSFSKVAGLDIAMEEFGACQIGSAEVDGQKAAFEDDAGEFCSAEVFVFDFQVAKVAFACVVFL